MSDLPRVRITGSDHPHKGVTGRVTGDLITMGDLEMMKVKIDSHFNVGADACFVTFDEVQILGEDDA